MNRETYRKAFDEIPFSDDFQARTTRLLRERALELKKEEHPVRIGKTKKLAALLAAAVCLLAVSVSAAVLWLTPSQVAESLDDPLLAEAFASKDAVVIDETRQVGNYTVALAGTVSGQDLSIFDSEGIGELLRDRTYLVFSLTDSNGTPIEEFPEGLAFTPLVSGTHVSAVNAWTLGASWRSFIQDGRAYYLYDTRNLEMFADRTVYFAVYEGFVPAPDQFPMAEEGSISLADDVNGTLFVLPLDENTADPEAVEAFLESTGLEFIN